MIQHQGDKEPLIGSKPSDQKENPTEPASSNVETPRKVPTAWTFLDDLTLYQELKKTGIPGRGVRRKYHRVLFSAGRVHGWFQDRTRIAYEWRMILGINPQNIGCTVEDGVNDMIGDWEAIKDAPFRFWLPDCTKLSGIDEARRVLLTQRLMDAGCPQFIKNSVRNVICSVLWPIVRAASVPCIDGRASIRARAIQECTGRKLRVVKEWMWNSNLLRVRDLSYEPGKRSRLYFVNIPMIIWLLGFRKDELCWVTVDRHESSLPSKTMVFDEEDCKAVA